MEVSVPALGPRQLLQALVSVHCKHDPTVWVISGNISFSITEIFHSPLEDVATDEVVPQPGDQETVQLVLEVEEREDVLGAVVHVPAQQLLDQVQLARLISSPRSSQA